VIVIIPDHRFEARLSEFTRHALTVALVNPGRGACWNQTINSFSAMLYTRFVIGEETAAMQRYGKLGVFAIW
jgi:hypothetical protein